MKNFSPNIAILIIVIFLIICAAVIFLSRQKSLFLQDNSSLSSPQISSTTKLVASESTQLSGSESAMMDQSLSSTSSATLALEDYIYPDAKTISQSQNKLSLESIADPDQITNWYKAKIRESGFNAKSFSQTNSNGVILNKLSGAKPGEKIEITIKKDQTGSKVAITVDRS